MKPEYLELVARVRRIDPAAADYLMGDEISGRSQSGDLDSVMFWETTPQGHYYWLGIQRKIRELPPEPDLFDCY